MEVHFTPEQETQLAQVAANAGTDPDRLVKDAALRVLSDSNDAVTRAHGSGGVVTAMRALRARVQPEPEGWSPREYVLYGCR